LRAHAILRIEVWLLVTHVQSEAWFGSSALADAPREAVSHGRKRDQIASQSRIVGSAGRRCEKATQQ
jgi:hypothetical protein